MWMSRWYGIIFDKNGEPKTGPEDGKASTSDFVRINGKTYLFDQKGNPVKRIKEGTDRIDQRIYVLLL